MTKQKIIWIDNLKVIGILAVILGHIASPFGSFIYSWHMPLFFIIAGFFIKFDLSIISFIKKDFTRLMIPYLIFSIIGLLLEILKRMVLHRDELDYIYELKGIFIWMDISSLMNTYAFVLWFLPALFFSRVLIVILNKYITNLFVQFILVSGLFSSSFLFELPFGIDNALNALLFVFIGNSFFIYYQNIKILYILPFMTILIYLFFGIPSLDVASKNYDNIFINIFASIGLVFFLIQVLKQFNYSNYFLKIWGTNTMLIFIIHPYTNNIAHIIVEKVQFGDWYLKILISLFLLQILLFIKLKLDKKGIFKYV